MKATLSRITEGSPKVPNVIMGTDLDRLTVNGKPISIEKVQKGIPNLFSSLEDDFVNKVCCGLTFPALDKDIDDGFDPRNEGVFIFDNLREQTVGYNVIEDPQNPFAKHKRLLLDAFMDRDYNSITGNGVKLYREDASGGIHFDSRQLRIFYHRVDEFMVVSWPNLLFLFLFLTLSSLSNYAARWR